MSAIDRMFATHPEPVGDGDAASACVDACLQCLAMCDACADACLREEKVADLVQCIRLNLDCAEICGTTGRLFSRPGHTDAALLRAQLHACVAACDACAAECETHGHHMEHCAICAESCRACAAACGRMADAIVP